MRGKGFAIGILAPACGITPAHAGKRSNVDMYDQYGKDHPRTCGEKSDFLCLKLLLLQSPPHMRGKVFLIIVRRKKMWITPAHAGKRKA